MFNLSTSIDALRDAETIIASTLLSDDERTALLREVVASIPENFVPPYAVNIRNAVTRRIPPEQGREAEGKQDAAEVAEGSDQAPEGETSGKQEQAEVDTRVPSGSGGNREAQARPPKAKGRKAR